LAVENLGADLPAWLSRAARPVVVAVGVLAALAFCLGMCELAYEIGGITGVVTIAVLVLVAAVLRHPVIVALFMGAILGLWVVLSVGDGPGRATQAYWRLNHAAIETLDNPPPGLGIVIRNDGLEQRAGGWFPARFDDMVGEDATVVSDSVGVRYRLVETGRYDSFHACAEWPELFTSADRNGTHRSLIFDRRPSAVPTRMWFNGTELYPADHAKAEALVSDFVRTNFDSEDRGCTLELQFEPIRDRGVFRFPWSAGGE